jgi:hypothetical protein
MKISFPVVDGFLLCTSCVQIISIGRLFAVAIRTTRGFALVTGRTLYLPAGSQMIGRIIARFCSKT